jgi:hypothetical protein
MVHDEPAGIGPAMQVLVWLKGPVSAMLETCKGPVPVLWTVIVRAVLVVPITWDWKERLPGETEIPGVVPVPISGTL